jgi:hypothetical protein
MKVSEALAKFGKNGPVLTANGWLLHPLGNGSFMMEDVLYDTGIYPFGESNYDATVIDWFEHPAWSPTMNTQQQQSAHTSTASFKFNIGDVVKHNALLGRCEITGRYAGTPNEYSLCDHGSGMRSSGLVFETDLTLVITGNSATTILPNGASINPTSSIVPSIFSGSNRIGSLPEEEWKETTRPIGFYRKVPKCECGSEACGSSAHSHWCPRFEA